MMRLNFNQIREMAWGTVYTSEENGCLCFYRCTKEQTSLFESRSRIYYANTFGTAGVRIVFRTDSERLLLKVRTEAFSDRLRFSFDVFSDDRCLGYLDNFSDVKLPPGEERIWLPTGDFDKEFDLGTGEKTVTIHFPYSVKGMIRGLELDDGSYAEPVKACKMLLAYGDSITQGYNALRPSGRYAARLADYLNAQEICKAIADDRFCPRLATLTDDVNPDYILVAYGTNDWGSNRDRKTFREYASSFLHTLRGQYKEAEMIVITPIWRKDYKDERVFGDFTGMDSELTDAAKDMDKVIIIKGFDLVPHDESFYEDYVLHPNDKGFEEYFRQLKRQF